jgi:hypothetical protein
MQDLGELLEAHDFEGAEELLFSGMGSMRKYEPFFHFQLGKVYCKWNKLSSALDHLGKAAELARSSEDEVLAAQVTEEIRQVKKLQAEQRP